MKWVSTRRRTETLDTFKKKGLCAGASRSNMLGTAFVSVSESMYFTHIIKEEVHVNKPTRNWFCVEVLRNVGCRPPRASSGLSEQESGTTKKDQLAVLIR